MVSYVPKRADLVWLNFEPQAGREITKFRPALVISPEKYNKLTGLALFIPITSQIKNYPFEIIIETQDIKGALLCDQIRSLDWRMRQAKKIISIDTKILDEAVAKLKLLIS